MNYETPAAFRSRQARWLAMIVAAAFLSITSRWALAEVTTIFSDNFAADPLGSVPVTPLIGQPWETSGWIRIVADPYFSTNCLGFGSFRSTVVMRFSTASQTVMAANENFTFSFQYHGIAVNGFTPYLDISGDDTTTGNPAFLFRIMSQPTTPSGGLHEIYYLDKTSGLTDTGLAVPANSLQVLTIATDFVDQTSQLSVGASTATLPLYTCPSMIQDVSLSNFGFIIGSGMCFSNIDQVTATTSSTSPADPNAQAQTPEPSELILLLTAAVPVGWWLWRRRKATGRRAVERNSFRLREENEEPE